MTSARLLRSSRVVIGAALVCWISSGCVLTGIEPDEIDVADGSESGASTGGLGDGEGDGDEDAAEASGDEAGETGEGDPADGESCLPLISSADLVEGDNLVTVPDASSTLTLTCGGSGPEAVLQFVAPTDGDWSFTATSAEFVPVLALVLACEPLDELACVSAGQAAVQPLSAGERIYVVLDSDTGAGAATVSVTKL